MRSTIIAVCFALSLLVLMRSAFGEDNRWESVPKPKTVSDTGDRLQQGPQQEMPSVDIERQQRMISVLKKPPVPLKTPDKILRVLFLPYVDQNNILNNYKYSFMKVEEGKWVIGDYLLEPARADRAIINPIENVQKPGSPAAPKDKGQTKQDLKAKESQ